MILELTTKSIEVKPSSFTPGALDVLIKSDSVNVSQEEMEHLIDFVMEVYPKKDVISYINRIYAED